MRVEMPELSRTQYEEIISEWILSERDRNVTRRRLLDGMTYEQISEEFNLSVSQTKRIVYKSQKKVLDHVS